MPATRSATGISMAHGYGYGFGKLNRSIVFPGVARGASGSPDANEFLSNIETGYQIPVGSDTTLTPFAIMQGITIFQSNLTEGGARAIDLQVRGETTSSARSVLGAELAQDWQVGLSVPLSLTLRAGWAHEFANVSRSIVASFVGLPGAPFTVNGASVPRDAAVIGVSASLRASQSLSVLLRYDGALACGASMHAGTVGLRIAF